MATQKIRPNRGSVDDPQTDERRRARNRKRGSLALAAIVGAIAILIAVVAAGPEEQKALPPTVAAPGGAGTEPKASPTNSEPLLKAGVGPQAVSAAPAISGDVREINGDEAFSVGFSGLPPEGATPSGPLRGELVKSDWGIHPWWATYLYADGRLIWATASSVGDRTRATTWIEQRLTPRGVNLLRSASTLNTGSLPASAWEDRKLRPYVASKYMVVATYDLVTTPQPQPWLDPPRVMSELPARARDLLRGVEPIGRGGRELTTDDARALVEILTDSGFERTSRESSLGVIQYTRGRIFGIDVKRHYDVIEFHPILPDGHAHLACYACG